MKELIDTLKMLRVSIDELQDRRMALENCDYAIRLAEALATKPDRAALEKGRE